jgi:ubiquinone biosynthesis protein COQ9
MLSRFINCLSSVFIEWLSFSFHSESLAYLTTYDRIHDVLNKDAPIEKALVELKD